MTQNCKITTKKIGEKFFDIGLGNDFLNMTPKAKATKSKIKKCTISHWKSSAQKKEKSNLWNGRKYFKIPIWLRVISIRKSYNSAKEPKNPIKKWTEDKIDIFPKKHTNGQQVHEKMLNSINHQGNTNQNYNVISPQTY